jgi:hypothetical protein
MIWSILRLIVATRMLRLSRWLLRVGGAIIDEEFRDQYARVCARGSTPISSGPVISFGFVNAVA